MLAATAMAHSLAWKSSTYVLHLAGWAVPGSAGLYVLVVNLVLTGVLTPIFNALKLGEGRDQTLPGDYDVVALGD